MENYIWQIISGLLLTADITLFLFFKSERKKRLAEAESAFVGVDVMKLDVRQKDIDLQQDQFDFLIDKLNYFQKSYVEIQEQMNQMTSAYTKEIINLKIDFNQKINDKCNELSEWKGKVVYYKGFRCYKSDCPMRNQVHIENNNEQ